MGIYEKVFENLGLKKWCGAEESDGPMTMAQLLAKAGKGEAPGAGWEIPFPSLDRLHESCGGIPRSRDMTAGLERLFLEVKNGMKTVLDPLTQPLSWLLDGSLYIFSVTPWWVVIPVLAVITQVLARSYKLSAFVAGCFLFLSFIDYYTYALQTLSIIFVCTILSVLLGVPLGIAMSKSNPFQKMMIPVLDLLQTLPSFVYLIPLVFLFSVTESKLYGIAIILYAIVPVIRLTDLGIRLVDVDVLEAADAYGLNFRQKLFGVEIPLSLPNIMAGVNQTIMMALAMVVIASLVSAPGLGVLVLRGIRNSELGVGLVSGLSIVLLAIILDRISKLTLQRINYSQNH